MVTFLSGAACLLGMSANWCLARGSLRAGYRLGFLTGVCYAALNGLLAWRGDPGLALLVVPSLWMVATSALGLRRLGKVG